MLLAGKITGAYGIKGWVKVHALTDPVENFLSFDGWQVRRRNRFESIEFIDGKTHGKGLIAKVRGVETRTDAETMRGLEVYVPSTELPVLEDGDFYWFELQGMQVWTRQDIDGDGESTLLGVVDHLLETGANDVLVLEPCEGSIDERQRLIPYVMDTVVQRVDRDAQRIDVDWHPED